MKSRFSATTVSGHHFMRLLLFATLVVLAAGCGQKGPLYLSNNPPPGVKPPKDTYKPVPYPKEAQRGDADAAK